MDKCNMKDEKYNGWTNYHTWAVNLWMNSEYGTYKYWREEARIHYDNADDCGAVWDGHCTTMEVARHRLADQLKEHFEDESPLKECIDLYSDLLVAALGEVDWHEIANALLDDIAPSEDSSPDIIDGYSRADAIEDGVLIDASEMAKEAGLKFPVAITATVWGQYVKVPDDVEGQNEQGRLWDILNMALFAIKRGCEGSELLFTVMVNNDGEPKPVQLRSICGPGDDAEPVITIMLPHED